MLRAVTGIIKYSQVVWAVQCNSSFYHWNRTNSYQDVQVVNGLECLTHKSAGLFTFQSCHGK